jgi:acetyl esterase
MKKQKIYTREELIAKTRFIKKMAERSGRSGRGEAAGKVNGTERYFDTEAGRVRTLVYRFDEAASLPLFINIHGGGFILGHPEMDDPYMPRVAREAGVKIISIDYSLAPEAPFPKALDECYAVVKYAQTHAGELGVDPGRVAIGGHSAGGNFSAAVCLKNAKTRELAIRCAILDYPPMDIYTDAGEKPRGRGVTARFFLSRKNCRLFDACYCPDPEERKNPLVSPVYAAREDLASFPPTLIITAGKDSLCAEAELFRDRLLEAGVEVSHKRFEKSPHGFTLNQTRSDAAEGWNLMINFLKAHC